MTDSDMDSKDKLVYERAMLVPRGVDGASVRKALEAVYHALSSLPADAFNTNDLSEALGSQVQGSHVGPDALLCTLRVAITGSAQPVDISEVMSQLGKARTMRRLKHAIQELMVVA